VEQLALQLEQSAHPPVSPPKAAFTGLALTALILDAGFGATAAVAACCLQQDVSQQLGQFAPLHVGDAGAVVDAALAATLQVEQDGAAAVAVCGHDDWPLHAFSQHPVQVAAGAADSAAVIRSIANAHVANTARIKTAGVDFMSSSSVTSGRKTGES
jgi:hypothetical protein